MKRAAIALMLILPAGCISSGIFARVDVACGANALIYSNASKLDQKITVQAADRCAHKDSEVQLVNANGTVVQTFVVPDGKRSALPLWDTHGYWRFSPSPDQSG